MSNESGQPRIHVVLTARWGNDDAESTIKVSRRRWRAIQAGSEYRTAAWGWYECRRFPVEWRFAAGGFDIGGEDGRECVSRGCLSELTVKTEP